MKRQRYKTQPSRLLYCQGKRVTDKGCELVVTAEVEAHVRLGRLVVDARPAPSPRKNKD